MPKGPPPAGCGCRSGAAAPTETTARWTAYAAASAGAGCPRRCKPHTRSGTHRQIAPGCRRFLIPQRDTAVRAYNCFRGRSRENTTASDSPCREIDRAGTACLCRSGVWDRAENPAFFRFLPGFPGTAPAPPPSGRQLPPAQSARLGAGLSANPRFWAGHST